MEITWGILLFAFGAGFLAATLFAVLVGFWIRATVSAHSKEIEEQNQKLRQAVTGYEEAYKKMRAVPPPS